MDLWSSLKHNNKPILLYGMGDGAEKILSVLHSFALDIDGIFVSDDFLRDKVFHGHKLLSFSQAEKTFGSFIVLVAFGTSRHEVLQNIKSVSRRQTLYVPDVPVVGTKLFSYQFAKENADKIRYVYDRLDTAADRYIYESIIRFKLTGKPEYLYRSYSEKSAVYNVLSLKGNITCVDCGAFTGDTVGELLYYNSDCSKIYAVEPDEKTYKKLLAFSEKKQNVYPINAAVSNNEDGITFSASGNRGSKNSDRGKLVSTVYIDKLLNGEKADYIKFDVEGMEKEAINGAYNTIKNYKPKMLVSCYHRSEDVFELPLQILNIRNDYRLKIYHPLYLPAWDSAFLCI